jgi:glycosyltransferase involved in cell wall biosynthesis
MSAERQIADVCLILEGTYPYVTGGVSTWTHDLITAQKDLSFHLVTLLPIGASTQLRYEIPKNVVSHSTMFVQQLPDGHMTDRAAGKLCEQLEEPLLRIQSHGGVEPLAGIIEAIRPFRAKAGKLALLNSPAAWNLLRRMYERTYPDSSFLDYFWSWRALLGGMYSVLLGDLPKALVYHTVSTGYAGLMATRAGLETGRPVLLTEHGIYTNERRIEIGMADWLHTSKTTNLDIESRIQTLKDLWINTFVGYSRACYEVANEIITLYEGNQQFQLQDGAAPEKLRVIPNGIDYDRFSGIRREAEQTQPTIALIGRVVPIKDVKTFVRACGLLKDVVPGIRAFVMGPTEEDPEYFHECETLVRHLGIEEVVTFTGKVKLDEYLGRVDLVVLTSISEAQPLTILEAGAAGIPSVATDVGACREMIIGRLGESPALGPGGAVTPLCNPASTAAAIAKLLNDPQWYRQCSHAIRERVRRSYNKTVLDKTYRDVYDTYRQQPASAPSRLYCGAVQ